MAADAAGTAAADVATAPARQAAATTAVTRRIDSPCTDGRRTAPDFSRGGLATNGGRTRLSLALAESRRARVNGDLAGTRAGPTLYQPIKSASAGTRSVS